MDAYLVNIAKAHNTTRKVRQTKMDPAKLALAVAYINGEITGTQAGFALGLKKRSGSTQAISATHLVAFLRAGVKEKMLTLCL